jgi:hypothetical protein
LVALDDATAGRVLSELQAAEFAMPGFPNK